jgi:radical SAM superfamily enzyme YgiQ (UPF0313 family)
MKALLISPKYPDTYWSYKHALKFISKKAGQPPLGLMTVASFLPDKKWSKKLVDLNVSSLKDYDLKWADYVFISAMSVQSGSVDHIIRRAKLLNKKIVAGGPLFTEEFDKYETVDHLILNEAEITLPLFLDNLEKGIPHRIYQSNEYADITTTPAPDYSLIKLNKYHSASIQYSRGCPFNCEFCDVTALFGHKVRIKTTKQIITELNNLINIGWKGSVFFVDDNFIGNKYILKKELLPAIIKWMKKNDYPFIFTTEASINLSDDKELMELMVSAGFAQVFIGIETTEEASLAECNKTQNIKRDMVECVEKIQHAGIEVAAGFIVGFDKDPPSVFEQQIHFIQKSSIVSAMVGLLNAPKKTQLYRRLEKEGRIVDEFSGDNTDYSLNFVPVMDKEVLLNGYQKILQGVYSSKTYYARVMSFLKRYNPPFHLKSKITFNSVMAFIKSIFYIGIFKKNRRYYWELLFWSLFNKPKAFPMAVTYSILGYHYRKVFRGIK